MAEEQIELVTTGWAECDEKLRKALRAIRYLLDKPATRIMKEHWRWERKRYRNPRPIHTRRRGCSRKLPSWHVLLQQRRALLSALQRLRMSVRAKYYFCHPDFCYVCGIADRCEYKFAVDTIAEVLANE